MQIIMLILGTLLLPVWTSEDDFADQIALPDAAAVEYVGYEEAEDDGTEEAVNMDILITVNGQSFNARLYDNEAAKAFAALLPLSLTMSELNGNEKYYYLPADLPVSAENVGEIHTGDLMLYGSDCVALFYRDFDTSYSYTPLGRISETAGLAAAVGRGGAQVQFAAE